MLKQPRNDSYCERYPGVGGWQHIHREGCHDYSKIGAVTSERTTYSTHRALHSIIIHHPFLLLLLQHGSVRTDLIRLLQHHALVISHHRPHHTSPNSNVKAVSECINTHFDQPLATPNSKLNLTLQPDLDNQKCSTSIAQLAPSRSLSPHHCRSSSVWEQEARLRARTCPGRRDHRGLDSG